MGFGFRFSSMLLAAVFGAAAATAQDMPLAHASARSQMQLDVVVTAKSGVPVAELRPADFTLLDNKIPQPITSFRAVSGKDQPAEVILVIDAVNTSYQNIAYERDQISKYLRADGGRLAQPTTLAIFTDSGTQIQPGFSTDGNALSDAFNKYTIGLRTIRRSQGFYGASDRTQLSLGAIRMIAARASTLPGRKLVLWISPGWPLLSGPAIELDAKQQQGLFSAIVDLSTQLRKARVTLYGIDSIGATEGLLRADYYQAFLKGVSNPGQTQIGDLSLQVLAVQSGGLALNSTGVASLLNKCVQDTESYYELTFVPARGEKIDQYHSIEVKLARSGLTARTRAGYYAQP